MMVTFMLPDSILQFQADCKDFCVIEKQFRKAEFNIKEWSARRITGRSDEEDAGTVPARRV